MSTTAPITPDLSRLEKHLGDLVVEGEIARTARAVVYGVRLERHRDRSGGDATAPWL